MELRDLQYFAVVAEHRNLRRAAEALDLSQPALSKSLRRLESAARTKLVKRTPKGVELTGVGTALLAHARRLRLSLDEAAREILELASGELGHVRLGAGPAMAEDLLPLACEALFKRAPNVTIKVVITTNDVLLPSLRAGELDLIVSGIPATPAEDLVQTRLYEEELAVVASVDHPLARRKRIAIADLARERWVLAQNVLATRMLERAFEHHGLGAPQVAMEVSAQWLRLHVVSTSGFLAILPRSALQTLAARGRAVEIKVQGMHLPRRVGVSYRREAYLSPAAGLFIEILKTTATRMFSTEMRKVRSRALSAS